MTKRIRVNGVLYEEVLQLDESSILERHPSGTVKPLKFNDYTISSGAHSLVDLLRKRDDGFDVSFFIRTLPFDGEKITKALNNEPHIYGNDWVVDKETNSYLRIHSDYAHWRLVIKPTRFQSRNAAYTTSRVPIDLNQNINFEYNVRDKTIFWELVDEMGDNPRKLCKYLNDNDWPAGNGQFYWLGSSPSTTYLRLDQSIYRDLVIQYPKH